MRFFFLDNYLGNSLRLEMHSGFSPLIMSGLGWFSRDQKLYETTNEKKWPWKLSVSIKLSILDGWIRVIKFESKSFPIVHCARLKQKWGS